MQAGQDGSEVAWVGDGYVVGTLQHTANSSLAAGPHPLGTWGTVHSLVGLLVILPYCCAVGLEIVGREERFSVPFFLLVQTHKTVQNLAQRMSESWILTAQV